MLKKLFTFLFVFLFSSFTVTTVFAIGNTQLNVNQPITSQYITNDQLDGLKNEIQELKSANYQTVLNNYQLVGDKLNRYTDSLTLIASIFGVIIAMFTAFVGINFYITKKDFNEKLKEINNYVLLAKQNALSVKKLANETKRQTKTIPDLVKEFQNNRKEMVVLLNKFKKAKTKKVKEFDDALIRIQETEFKLSQKLLNTVSNIQTMNSQASIIAGSAPMQPVSFSPSYSKITPAGYAPFQENVFGVEKCSNCEKAINPLNELYDPNYDSLMVGPPLCSDCRKKSLV